MMGQSCNKQPHCAESDARYPRPPRMRGYFARNVLPLRDEIHGCLDAGSRDCPSSLPNTPSMDLVMMQMPDNKADRNYVAAIQGPKWCLPSSPGKSREYFPAGCRERQTSAGSGFCGGGPSTTCSALPGFRAVRFGDAQRNPLTAGPMPVRTSNRIRLTRGQE